MREGINEFNVKVCSLIDNIQVVDFASETNAVNKSSVESAKDISYNPTFVSSFEKSSLPFKETCKVIFKKQVNNLYIVIKSEDDLEMKKLSSLLQESETDTIVHLPSVSEVLLAKRKDNLLYRCCVEEAASNKDTYKVYFLDLGITEDVHQSAVRNLPENFKSYPLFAIKVLVESEESVTLEKCYNVQVLKQNTDDIYFIKVYRQYMFSSINCKELPLNVECNVVFCYKEGEKLFLQDTADVHILTELQNILLECSSHTSIPYEPAVGELVCAMSQLDNSWYRGCIEEVLSADKYKVFFIDYGNCETVQKEHLQSIPSAVTKFPSLCVPVKFISGKVMESIELEKMYSVIAESKASNNVQIIKLIGTEDIENTKKVVNIEPVCNKESENICKNSKRFTFTSCKSVPFNAGEQDIVIYNVDEEGYLFCAPFDTENIQANVNLPKLLTEHCKSNGIPFDGGCEPELDEMVIALYPEDNAWYRAAIIEKSHPSYDVNFVDYGNTEQLNVSCLRKMEEQFMGIDVQAHMCSLTGFTVPDENLPSVYEELRKFTIFSYPNPLKAHVQILDGDITANIPEITSCLMKKNLVTVVNQN